MCGCLRVLYSKSDLCFGTGPQWTDDCVYVIYIVKKCGLGYALGMSNNIVTGGRYLFWLCMQNKVRIKCSFKFKLKHCTDI